jgi:hypothetical protein
MELFDYDPLTGVTEYYDFDPITQKISIRSEENVEPLLDFCRAMRNEQIGDPNFYGEGWLYAAIPPTVQMELRRKGINILDENDTPRLLAEINVNYPWLKCSDRHHAM